MRAMLDRINFNSIKLFLKRNVIVISVCVFLILVAIALVPRAFAQPVRNIELASDSLNFETEEPGAWKVNKSSEWIDKGVAEITFDVDTVMKNKNKYTDVLFVFDVSSSMSGDKLNRVKSDTLELVNTLLKNDKNRVGLISFDTDSSILLGLTSDKDKITDSINNLEVGNTTNYYQALVNVDKVLEGYVKEEDRVCIVLFLTDGYPNVDTPNEVGQYGYLKKTYPFITINGIQYEMGDVVLEPIKNISDKQYISNMSTLNNVLFDAAYVQEEYNEFRISDYINTDYFSVKDSSDIKVSQGEAVLDESSQVINWNLDGFKSGSKAIMTIKAYLKEELIGKGGEYPTNKSEIISNKISNITDEVTSSKSPILADNYKVKYDANVPEGCKASDVPEEKVYSVFDTVELSSKSLSCEGYQFKGWNITTKDVKRVNDDYFVMPEEDVEIKGVWGKVSIDKSMDGEVSTIQTVYKMMEEQAVPDDERSNSVLNDNGIDFGSVAPHYNGRGVYLHAPTKNEKIPILYYRGVVKNNNVKFANFCWKIVRTTETGGIKMVYDGELDSEGNCVEDHSAAKFIGKSAFNQNSSSPADLGYMYGNRDDYISQRKIIPNWYNHVGKTSIKGTMELFHERYIGNGSTYYYGDSIEWDSENNQYVLKNSDGSEIQILEYGSGNGSTLSGKYTCLSSSGIRCNVVYYVVCITNTMYYIDLQNGNMLEDVNETLNYGKEISYENGAYTINNPNKIKMTDWLTNSSSIKDSYICPDGSVTCKFVRYVHDTNTVYNYDYYYIAMNGGESYESLYEQSLNKKWVYGNDVEWDGSKYILKDTYESSPISWSDDYKTIASKYHYTCFTTEDSCAEVGYIIYFSAGNPLYLKFKDGKNLDSAKAEMFSNVNSSDIKKTIDEWYKNNLLDYTDKLEDTIWCNDRSIYAGPLYSKDADSSGKNYITFFNAYQRATITNYPSLSCPNKNDSFTVSDKNGNGMLTYPIALLTNDEVTLAGGLTNDRYYNSFYLFVKNYNWWSISPSDYANSSWMLEVKFSGNMEHDTVSAEQYVRPAISLAPGTIITGGDGTATNPFTVDLY